MKTFQPSHQSAFSLYSFTGITEESGKNMETQVYGGGGGGGTYQGTGGTAPVSISSRTVVHDQLFLVSPEGKERAFQLQDFNLAARKGNQLSVFWGIQSGKNSGPYIAVKNHSTDQTFYQDKEVSNFFIKGWLQAILLTIGVILLLTGVLGGAGIIYTALGVAAIFLVWKKWNTAKREIADFKAGISSFSGE